MKVETPAGDLDRARRLATGWFASFDPGALNPAFALWDRGTLVYASRIKVPKELAKLDRGERLRQVARISAMAAVNKLLDLGGDRFVACAVEVPQVYGGGSKSTRSADPNDLILLAFIAGGFAAYLDCECIGVLPREWSGGIPKSKTGDAWESPRGRILSRRLTAAEVAAVVTSHDAVDAAGIGGKCLGKLERNLPGSI